MNQSPIHRVLSVLYMHQVRYLLMGGQACILYGGSEFSRDMDIAIMPEQSNADALLSALAELKAVSIAVPDFSLAYLSRGHAVHFRCSDPLASGIRIDIMSTLRNVDSFDLLWERRTTLELTKALVAEVLSLPDLIRAKKTQRDKDWLHIRRLIEADYQNFSSSPSSGQVAFWLGESRTPAMLKNLVYRYPQIAASLSEKRPILATIPDSSDEIIEKALFTEQESERILDRQYWAPLRAELERLRHEKKA